MTTKNVFYSMFVIALCLFLGKTIAAYIGGLPGSLYGMLLFTAALHIKLFSADKIKVSIDWIIHHMGVCFVPAGVGIINHFELIQQHGFSLVAIIFFTTFVVITLVGLIYEKMIMTQPLSNTSHSPTTTEQTNNEC